MSDSCHYEVLPLGQKIKGAIYYRSNATNEQDL